MDERKKEKERKKKKKKKEERNGWKDSVGRDPDITSA